jgi:hypothetical protein
MIPKYNLERSQNRLSNDTHFVTRNLLFYNKNYVFLREQNARENLKHY